jgi:prepilin-type N-terminal cleavage/methylation domain-containing protein
MAYSKAQRRSGFDGTFAAAGRPRATRSVFDITRKRSGGPSLRPFRVRLPFVANWAGKMGILARKQPYSEQVPRRPQKSRCSVVVTPYFVRRKKADGLFTGVSAEGGIRPGIDAGLTACGAGVSPAWAAGAGVSPAWAAGAGVSPAWAAGAGVSPAWAAGTAAPQCALAAGTAAPQCDPTAGTAAPQNCRVDAAAKRPSLIPNPQSLIPRSPFPVPRPPSPVPRSAFTLVEMLIVIGIMLILITAAATMMPSATEARRIREAARGVNIYLSSARNRAMETGRPCGVTFRCLGAVGCALNADQCEVPPCYCGDTDASAATLQWVSGVLTATLDAAPPTNLVSTGNLIQFNGQGPMYQINGMSGGTLTLGPADPNQNPLTPWPMSPSQSAPVPYRICPSPMKGGATPLQLPATAVVDLQWSGAGSTCLGWDATVTYSAGQLVTYNGLVYSSSVNSNIGNTPPIPPATSPNWSPAGVADFTVLFSPTGSVDSVYCGPNRLTVSDPLYLLIGKRGRVGNAVVAGNTNETTLTNWQDLNNVWVTINPQTGAVNTEPVAVGATVVNARTLAAQSQGMGGK